jgi:hypothetical protein
MRRTGGRRYRGREEGSLLSAASLLQTARPATVGRIRCGPATGGRSAAGIFCGTCRAGHAGAAGRQGPQQVGARRGARRGRRMGGRCTFSLVVVALRLVDAHLLADVFILLPERVEEVGDPRHPHRAPEHLPAVHLLPRTTNPLPLNGSSNFVFFPSPISDGAAIRGSRTGLRGSRTGGGSGSREEAALRDGGRRGVGRGILRRPRPRRALVAEQGPGVLPIISTVLGVSSQSPTPSRELMGP